MRKIIIDFHFAFFTTIYEYSLKGEVSIVDQWFEIILLLFWTRLIVEFRITFLSCRFLVAIKLMIGVCLIHDIFDGFSSLKQKGVENWQLFHGQAVYIKMLINLPPFILLGKTKVNSDRKTVINKSSNLAYFYISNLYFHTSRKCHNLQRLNNAHLYIKRLDKVHSQPQKQATTPSH